MTPGAWPLRRAAALFFLSAAPLLAEITWTRLLSVAQFHIFAFLAVSTALLGIAVGAQRVSAKRVEAGPSSDRRGARGALGFALFVPLGHVVSQAVGFDPFELRSSALSWLELGIVYVALALPFMAAGLALSEILERNAQQAPRLYAADLGGAALGSLLALLFIPLLSGPPALYAASALGVLSAALLDPSRPRTLAAAGLLAVFVASLVFPLPVHISRSKTTGRGEPFARVFSDPARHVSTTWTAHARVDRVRFRPGLERLVLDAGVAAVRIPALPFERAPTDATLPYELRPGGRVLVIGAGAGFEVKEALTFGAGRAVGVEVNPAVLAATPGFVRRDGKAELVLDDARSYLEKSPPAAFEAIVMVHTISNSAVRAGALGLTEDHLLTREAFERMLEVLTERGLLFVTRPEAQLPRLVATLREASPHPRLRDHVAVWREKRGGFYAAVLFSKGRFQPEEAQAIDSRLRARGLYIEHTPLAGPDPGTLTGALIAGADARALGRKAGLRLRPATDDAPFFHRRLPIRELFLAPREVVKTRAARLALEDRPLAELALLALFFESLVIGLALFLPVGLRRRADRGIVRTAVGFSALGVAFMLIEIALVQRLGLLLGAPTRSIAVSLAGVLLGAGLGSRLASSASPKSRGLLAGAAALFFAGLGEPIVRALLGTDEVLRTMAAALFAFGVGTALGGVFPAALRADPPGGAAFAFGVNAVASVCGISLALLLAPEVGLSGLGFIAAALYGVAAFVTNPRDR